MLFVAINQQIYGLGPSLQSTTAADEEILLVEDLQDLYLHLLYKQLSFSFKQAEDELTSAFHQQSALTFLFYKRKDINNDISNSSNQANLAIVLEASDEVEGHAASN